jgi:hypothetical protein
VIRSIEVQDTNKYVEMEEAFAKTNIDDEYMLGVLIFTLSPTFKRKLLECNSNQSLCNYVTIFCKQSKPNLTVN